MRTFSFPVTLTFQRDSKSYTVRFGTFRKLSPLAATGGKHYNRPPTVWRKPLPTVLS